MNRQRPDLETQALMRSLVCRKAIGEGESGEVVWGAQAVRRHPGTWYTSSTKLICASAQVQLCARTTRCCGRHSASRGSLRLTQKSDAMCKV
jgi:hypothetical protein